MEQLDDLQIEYLVEILEEAQLEHQKESETEFLEKSQVELL